MNTGTFFAYPTINPAVSQLQDRGETAFLAQWSHSEWTKFFHYCQTLRFSDGDVLITQASTERVFYLVAQGQFEILAPYTPGSQPRRINLMEAGSVIGGQSFLDGEPFTTEVRAVGEAEAMRFSHDAFEIFAAREPELARALLFDLGRLLSMRLRTLMVQMY